jgi:hypothetical protein
MICGDGCCADFIYAMDDLLAVEDPYAAKVASKHGVENDEIVSIVVSSSLHFYRHLSVVSCGTFFAGFG